MLTKNCDWRCLAQCDGQVVRELVQLDDLKAETVTRLWRHAMFEKKCQEDIAYQDCYSLCSKAYKDLDSLFNIVPDNYGGYKLTYVGMDDVPPDTVFKTCPVGFLAPVPDNITDLSVIKKTSQNNPQDFLMLGPVRFVNSDCNPNCEYDFTSQQRVVRIKTLTKVKSGDEIVVKYGAEFFEAHQCLCSSCKNAPAEQNLPTEVPLVPAKNSELPDSNERKMDDLVASQVYSFLLDAEIFDMVDTLLDTFASSCEEACSRKRKPRVTKAQKLKHFCDVLQFQRHQNTSNQFSSPTESSENVLPLVETSSSSFEVSEDESSASSQSLEVLDPSDGVLEFAQDMIIDDLDSDMEDSSIESLHLTDIVSTIHSVPEESEVLELTEPTSKPIETPLYPGARGWHVLNKVNHFYHEQVLAVYLLREMKNPLDACLNRTGF